MLQPPLWLGCKPDPFRGLFPALVPFWTWLKGRCWEGSGAPLPVDPEFLLTVGAEIVGKIGIAFHFLLCGQSPLSGCRIRKPDTAH